MGEKFHDSVIKLIGKDIERINPSNRNYPPGGPKTLMGDVNIQKYKTKKKFISEDELKTAIEKDLQMLIADFIEKSLKEPKAYTRGRAKVLDCYLYSRDDLYKKK
jgi:hypothetical protein